MRPSVRPRTRDLLQTRRVVDCGCVESVSPLFSAPVFQRRRGRCRRRRARRSMVKAKLRKKAERAERASKSATTVAGDAGEVAAAEDDVEDAMANLTSHHRRKVKKRAVFLESTS